MPIEIYPAEMEMLLSNGATIFDVSEEHLSDDKMPRSMHTEHLPLSKLGELEKTIKRDKPIIFCCRSGLLSYQAAKIAAKWTEQPVYYIPGGVLSVVDG